MPITRFNKDNTALLVIDIQEKLLPAITEHERVLSNTCKLIEASKLFGPPVTLTEQYPKGLGHTVSEITSILPSEVTKFEKLKFSAATDEVLSHLHQINKPNIILSGIESHICVLQSALDLATIGYSVGIPIDAISSCNVIDHEAAISRMRQNGVTILSTQMLIMELTGEAGTDTFKSILPLIK